MEESMLTFVKDETEKYIYELAIKKAIYVYGKKLPDIVAKRFEDEMTYIKNKDYSSSFMLAYMITKYAHENGQFTSSRGSIGSSLIAFLLGITNVKPLPPHYYCKKCGHTNFSFVDAVYSGFDLTLRKCPICQKELGVDGHNIPIEAFTLLNCDKPFKIDLCFPISFKENLLRFLKDNIGKEYIVENGCFNIDIHFPNDAHSKVNVLGFVPLEVLSRLCKRTGISPNDIAINNSEVYELFVNSCSIGLDSNEPATYGIPEFSTDFVREILKTTKPKNFGDLIRITNLSHGSNVWYKNAEDLITSNICDFRLLPSSPEDIFDFLIFRGIEKTTAINISKSVMDGLFRKIILIQQPDIKELFMVLDISEWYIEYFSKVRDMLPKSHSIEFTRLAVILAWYKINYLLEFNVENFNAYYPDIDLKNFENTNDLLY